MPGWLRRLVAPLERRWIRDPDERERHDELVKQRMSAPPGVPASPDDRAPARPDVGATGPEAEPSDR